MSCGVCFRKIIRNKTSNEDICCKICKRFFHGIHFNLTENDVQHIRDNKKDWTCTDCLRNRRLSKSFDSVKTVNEATVDIISPRGAPQMYATNSMSLPPADGEIDKQHTILKRSENVLSEDDIVSTVMNMINTSLGSTLKRLDENISDMKHRFLSFEKSMEEIKRVVEENKTLKKQVSVLEDRVDRMEQELLESTIEFINVPSSCDSNLVDSISTIINTGLHVSVDKSSIVRCQRLHANGEKQRQGKVKIKMISTVLKDEIMQKIRAKRSIPAQIVDPMATEDIFIAESLTAKNRKLLFEARQLKSKGHFSRLWTRNGNIMMRKVDGGKIFYIKSSTDLQNLIKLHDNQTPPD